MIVFNIIDKIKEKRIFKVLYYLIVVLMAIAFIISGIRKFPGIEFTILPDSNPVGAYFSAMHATGFYWNFIGYFQALIGLLSFIKKFTPLTSLLMMPVTVNIFLVSIALQMKGTPYITSMMLLGNIFMLLWNYKNYKLIFYKTI